MINAVAQSSMRLVVDAVFDDADIASEIFDSDDLATLAKLVPAGPSAAEAKAPATK